MTTRLEVPLEINFLHSPSKCGDYSPFSSSTGVALKIRSENICTQNLLLPGTQNSGVFVSLPSRGINGTDISRPTDRERSDNDSDIISGYPAIFRISGYEFGYFIQISDTDTIWVISGQIIQIGNSDSLYNIYILMKI